MVTTTDATAGAGGALPAPASHSILHWVFAAGPLVTGGHMELRDVGLLLGALALARLSELCDTPQAHDIDPTLSEEEQEIERRYE